VAVSVQGKQLLRFEMFAGIAWALTTHSGDGGGGGGMML